MLNLSEVLMEMHHLQTFGELIEVIKNRALGGEIHFRIDVKPPFSDTPEDWEDRLEAAFYEPNRVTK
ncbi:MAG: sulfur relay protein DsrC [Gammaproteobacteria bacterium]|nr:MAG: sulfur relay protein DsrC [Gammaproteobacteria bacterium]